MKSNKGITLIELLVAMAISSIIIGLIATAVVSNIKLYNKAQSSNQAQIVAADVFDNVNYYFASEANRVVTIVDALPEPANYKHNEDYIYVKDGYLYLLEFSKVDIDPRTGKYIDDSGTDVTDTVGTIIGDSKLCFQGGEDFTYKFSIDVTQENFIDMEIVADLYPNDDVTFTDHIYLRKNTKVDIVTSLAEGTILKIVNVPDKLIEAK